MQIESNGFKVLVFCFVPGGLICVCILCAQTVYRRLAGVLFRIQQYKSFPIVTTIISYAVVCICILLILVLCRM